MAKREVVKKGKNFVIYSDGTIRVDNVRGSYLNWARPGKPGKDGGEPSYSATGIMPKGTHKEAMLAIKAFIEQMLADAKKKVGKDKWFLRNGDDSDKDEYANAYTVSCREKKRPRARDKDKSPLDPHEDAEKIISGYWVNLLIRPWIQDNDYGKRVNANFVAIQLVRKDKPFGEGQLGDDDIDDSFDDVDDGDDDIDDDDDDGL